MFKKVQLKFFAIITSILLAIFIAVLGSINIIMEAVMQRQSKITLKQIAAGVEYNEATSTFTFTPEGGDGRKEHEQFPPFSSPGTISDNYSETTTTEEKNKPSQTETTVNAPEPTTNENDSEGNSENVPQNSEESNENSDIPVVEVQPETNNQPVTTVIQKPENQNTTQTIAPIVTEPPVTVPKVSTTTHPQPIRPDKPPDGGKDERPTGPYPYWKWWEENGNQNIYPPEQQDYDGDDYNCYPSPYEYWGWYGYPLNPNVYEKEKFDDYDDDDDLQGDGSVSMPTSETSIYTGNTINQYAEVELLALNTEKNRSILEGYSVINYSPTIKKSESVGGKYEPAPVPKSLGSIEFFIIMANKNGKFIAALNNDDLDSELAQTYINAIKKNKASSGMVNSYQFCSLEKDNGTIMVFTDKSAEIDMLDQLTQTTILIGVVTFVILSVLAFFLSKKSIEPIKIAFEKQKQFVSDASHELKTPLTVISANADVLSGEIGENKWLNYIKSQTERMNVLVNDLLNLTRIENNASDFIITEFNLSQAITNTALPFECQAFESNKKFEVEIEEGITINGSERHIKQMVAIFIDNALKYSNDGGTVIVSLKKQGDKKILSIFNTGCGIHKGEENKIFERFYRSDDSRSRITGGYGLGLAIAKSIIDKHKFKISVENIENSSICFIITM